MTARITIAEIDRAASGAVQYVGRFAPSPTGPLHIGSVTTAVASFLHARQHGGRWLVRIEDIDPPREVHGAADQILQTLETLDLNWDGAVLRQSTRFEAYRTLAETLLQRGAAFRCSCTRAELRSAQPPGPLGHRYPGWCRKRTIHRRRTALRVRVADEPTAFDDLLQGCHAMNLHAELGDYVIYRRDSLPAYHLAVVADDAAQGITDIVRGSDLLESTAVHTHLYRQLGLEPPRHAHVPVLTNRAGEKLSKQTGATPVMLEDPSGLATRALRYLGAEVPPELRGAPPAELWQWATTAWRIEALRARRAVPADRDGDRDPK